jgi:hypothetical protein
MIGKIAPINASTNEIPLLAGKYNRLPGHQ